MGRLASHGLAPTRVTMDRQGSKQLRQRLCFPTAVAPQIRLVYDTCIVLSRALIFNMHPGFHKQPFIKIGSGARIHSCKL